jgi:hypothetical protein
MDFENIYRAELKSRELEADRFVDGLRPSTPRQTPLEIAYEFIDATVFHTLHPTDGERNQLVRSAFLALLLNRDVDHVPEYAGKLCGYLDTTDPGNVLDLARGGQSFLFAGFHTGPYWAIFQALVENRLNIATLFPGSLETKRNEIYDVFASGARHFGSESTLDLISLEDPNFLVRLRSAMSEGRQLVVFLDGNSGAAAQRNEKRDVELDFFDAKITIKTTVLRLADILGLPLVTFNAVRKDIRRTLLLDLPLPIGRHKDYGELARTVFGRLSSRLKLEPAQWEGWLYFHTYFSPAYRASLSAAEPDSRPILKKASRYFIQHSDDHPVIIDKQTYKQYRIRQREGVQA